MLKFGDYCENLKEEHLLEGRDAPLYHGTKLQHGFDILADGIIAADTEHDYSPDLSSNVDSIRGVSLTRERQFGFAWAKDGNKYYMVFKLDQKKLAHNYKLIPYVFGNQDKSSQIPGRQIHSKRYAHLANEFEEFCVTNRGIPVNQYVTKVYTNLQRREFDYALTIWARGMPALIEKVRSYDKIMSYEVIS